LSFESDFPSVLAAARGGADWAWTLVYREYSPAVLRYLRGQGAHEPEDLLGEVFVQVVRNIGGFDGGEREFRSWVFMIAHNRLVDSWRQRGRGRVDFLPPEELADVGEAGDSEREAMGRLGEAGALRVIGRLTGDQRDVIFLRYFAQLSIEEVASVLGKRPGAVKSLQARGLATIRRDFSL